MGTERGVMLCCIWSSGYRLARAACYAGNQPFVPIGRQTPARCELLANHTGTTGIWKVSKTPSCVQHNASRHRQTFQTLFRGGESTSRWQAQAKPADSGDGNPEIQPSHEVALHRKVQTEATHDLNPHRKLGSGLWEPPHFLRAMRLAGRSRN